ncbi:MAG: ParB N-terminal domain-containing protein [Planctomycetota bacterium]
MNDTPSAPAGQATDGGNGKPPRRPKPKFDHDRIRHRRIDSIRPAPENLRLYRPINPTDPEMVAMAASVRKNGILTPLVVSLDDFIISGHRRYVAAQMAGRKTVPVRVKPVRRNGQFKKFLQLLREENRQRVKTRNELLREEVVSADPEEAYLALIEHRQQQSICISDTITIRAPKERAAITAAKWPFLDAAIGIVEARRKFWPLSDRQLHYALLNDPPLIHASKPGSTYANTPRSYRALVDLLTRARLEGHIPMEAIGDETRPVVTWNVHNNVAGFLRRELDSLFKGYWRDLMQSQPNHVEVVGEKNTIAGIIRPVCAEYCITYTLGRGYCSLPPRHQIVERYSASGKDRLTLLVLSDFDPDGEEIAHSFARSMRDDFGIDKITAVKVALTVDQVEEYELPPMMKAKTGSATYDRFTTKYGDDVFELEALDPETLQTILRDAIDSVIDVDAFNAEIDAEKADAAYLQGVRRTVHDVLQDLDLGNPDGDHGTEGDTE